MVWFFLLMAVIVALDQLSKWAVVGRLPYGETVEFVHPILDLHHHHNSGAAWGILADHPWVFMLLSTVAVIAIIVFFVLYRKKSLPVILKLGLAMIAGGGIGNLIDRFAQGYVVDFLEFGFFDFPIFNVADSFVTVGAALMMIYLFIDAVKDLKAKKRKAREQETKRDEA